MATAEYEVLIRRDAMAVYLYLLEATNLPLWRDGVRTVKLARGSAGTKGAVYRQMVAGRSGLSIPAELEITEARPGAEIQFRIVSGPAHRLGGYYLSSEADGTRVRFALATVPEGVFSFLNRPAFGGRLIQRGLRSDVAQLENLRMVMELQTAA